MSYIPSDNAPFRYNIAESQRFATPTTLTDGKILGQDDTDLFQNVGTGSSVFSLNGIDMSVTAGQFVVRQSTRHNPYFSGKAQLCEFTFEDFGGSANAIKRIGYFDSSAVSPYDSSFDGFFIENNAGVYSLQMYRNGVQIVNVPFNTMDNYAEIASYNWDNFTVVAFDFLWLGGAGLRFFVKTDSGFSLIHTVKWAGNNATTFMVSPNKPIRYELRSNGDAAQLRYVCSQVATEGDINIAGKTRSYYNSTSIVTNSISEIYPLIAIRKSTTFRDVAFQIVSTGVQCTASSDAGILMLVKNAIQAGTAMTFNSVDKIEVAYNSATNQRLTANTGILIASVPVSQFGSVNSEMKENFLSMLSIQIDNTADIFYVAYMPTTSNQSNNATLTIKEF